MCGRYGFIPPADFYARFEIENSESDLKPNYNVAPGMVMPVVAVRSPKKLYAMRWGLVPFWAQELSIGYKMINARAEGIAQKPSFRKPFKSQRCLVPASGFYEWDKVSGSKQPYYIHLAERDVFAFAGLFDVWEDAGGKDWLTYTIITTEPNELVGRIHDRMPVILHKEDEAIWADNSTFEEKKLSALLASCPAEKMELRPVSKLVNSPRNNKPEVMEIDKC